jgi:CubicO group peptidase (beta-lactamase class C family)
VGLSCRQREGADPARVESWTLSSTDLLVRYWLLIACCLTILALFLSLVAQLSRHPAPQTTGARPQAAYTSLHEALAHALSAPGAWSSAAVTVAVAQVEGLAAEVSLVGGSVAAPSFAVSSPEVSRLVTALLVLESVRLGELGLDEPIARALPELDTLPRPLMVRDLLRGDTGLRDIRDVLEVRGLGEARTASAPEALGWVARQRVLRRVPSTWDNDVSSRESPTEDLLLALAVESRAGAPFPALAAARLFAPLGMDATHVALERGGSVASGALLGFRGVVTTARDLARLGVELVTCESLAPELSETELGWDARGRAEVRTRTHGARWCAKDARAELGRTWRAYGNNPPRALPGVEPKWFRDPETARLAVLSSEGWAVAAVTPPGDAPAGALTAVVAAATKALEPRLPPLNGFNDYLGIGGGSGGAYGGRIGTVGTSQIDDTRLLGEHKIPELGLSLTVQRVVTATRPRYEVRLEARRPVVGGLMWLNESLMLMSVSDSHKLTLRVALDGNSARFESLDLEYGLTTYGPLLALVVEAKDGK